MDQVEAMRILIVHRAMNEAFLGGHYLNGSDGGFPGMKDGLDGRDVKLIDSPGEMVIRSASISGHSCAGRCDQVGGSKINITRKKIIKTGVPGAGVVKAALTPEEKVEEYCQQLQELLSKGTLPAAWGSFDGGGLYPRTGVEIFNNRIVLGEDCSGKRHFDCISFIKWVLTTTLQHDKLSASSGGKYSYDIVQHEGRKQNDGESGNISAPGKHYDRPFPELKNADILTKIKWNENRFDEKTGKYTNSKGNQVDNKFERGRQHIGFYMAGGKVIEASGAARGVIISEYNANDWTGMFRIHDRYLKFGP